MSEKLKNKIEKDHIIIQMQGDFFQRVDMLRKPGQQICVSTDMPDSSSTIRII